MQVFITGVSRGLGLALAEEFLGQGHFVTGIGRSTKTQADKYRFISCDLASHAEVEALELEIQPGLEVLLINNAGIIRPVQRISDQERDFSAEIFQVNTLAPIQLMRKFMRASEQKGARLSILNISSGAGRRAIPSWANYCASKAALDLFSETLQLEEREKGKDTRIFSVAPGVIATQMQENIRQSNSRDFSSLETFQQLFESGQLQSPAETARRLRFALEQGSFDGVITRLA